eukprot:UN23017
MLTDVGTSMDIVVNIIYEYLFFDDYISAIHTSIGRSKKTGGLFLNEHNEFYKRNQGRKSSKLKAHTFTKKARFTIVDSSMMFTPYPELYFWIKIEDVGVHTRVGKFYDQLKEFHFYHISDLQPKIKFPSVRETRKLGKAGSIQKAIRRLNIYLRKITSHFIMSEGPIFYEMFVEDEIVKSQSEFLSSDDEDAKEERLRTLFDNLIQRGVVVFHGKNSSCVIWFRC